MLAQPSYCGWTPSRADAPIHDVHCGCGCVGRRSFTNRATTGAPERPEGGTRHRAVAGGHRVWSPGTISTTVGFGKTLSWSVVAPEYAGHLVGGTEPSSGIVNSAGSALAAIRSAGTSGPPPGASARTRRLLRHAPTYSTGPAVTTTSCSSLVDPTHATHGDLGKRSGRAHMTRPRRGRQTGPKVFPRWQGAA